MPTTAAPLTLRPYQSRAVEAALGDFKDKQATLIVCPTAGGKTVTAAEVIKRMPHGRVMFLVHRYELLRQAVQTIEQHTGEQVGVEMAGDWADMNRWGRHRIVASSVQTQYSGQGGKGRMTRFDPSEFSLLVVDEADMYVAPTWQRVIAHYKSNPDLRVLCITATPDRADEQALSQIVDSVADVYEIRDAIEDGWLVPVKARTLYVDGLDLSGIKTNHGDFHKTRLSEIMEQEAHLHEIADPTFKISDNRRTIVFAISIAQAEKIAEILNRHEHGCAACVSQKTPPDARAQTFEAFNKGDIRFLCNVGIVSRGWNEPFAEVVVIARPTKSRNLYAQQVGRILRPLPGLVDRFDTAEQRRNAIANSDKPFAEILDFHGVVGRHRLVHPPDVLGGKFSEAVVERANQTMQDGDTASDVLAELDKAQQEQEAIEREEAKRRLIAKEKRDQLAKQHIIAHATYTETYTQVFDELSMIKWHERSWDKLLQPSQAQIEAIRKMTGGAVDARHMYKRQAHQFLGTLIQRAKQKMASFKQVKCLRRYGHPAPESLPKRDANKLITAISGNGWQLPRSPAWLATNWVEQTQ